MSKTLKPSKSGSHQGFDGHINGGNGDDGYGGNGGMEFEKHKFDAVRLGVWLFVGSLSTMFGALAAMYVFHSERPYFSISAPKLFWVSTLLIIVASVFLEFGLRRIRLNQQKALVWLLLLGLLCGIGFMVSQTFSWAELSRMTLRGSSNAIRVQFYLLTGVHAVHVLIGIGWLGYVLRLSFDKVFEAQKHLAVSLCTLYWHFMGGVWIIFFLLLNFL